MALTDDDKRWITEQLEPLASLERLEQIETRLLVAFQKWSEPRDARLQAGELYHAATTLQIAGLNQRVKDLEEKK